jgi:hypothetical protein
LLGTIPIFILEGEAPLLKQDIIEKRLNNNNKALTKNNVIVRRRLNSLQKQVSINFIIYHLNTHNIKKMFYVYCMLELENAAQVLNEPLSC